MAKVKMVKQIAALPIHVDKKGKIRVLMVTSRDTGRWVMPKGWTMDGKNDWEAAKTEALEEAGAVGFVSDHSIGTYRYKKWLGKNRTVLCKVVVYPMMVDKLKQRWKERKERKRHWFSLNKAAKLVNEPELTDILHDLAKHPEKLTEREEFSSAA